MEQQEIEVVLGMVKARLNRLDRTLDEYLKIRIEAGKEELAQNGIHLVEWDVRDELFLCDWVCWTYSNRDKSEGMPKWLEVARKERFLSDKGVNNDGNI